MFSFFGLCGNFKSTEKYKKQSVSHYAELTQLLAFAQVFFKEILLN